MSFQETGAAFKAVENKVEQKTPAAERLVAEIYPQASEDQQKLLELFQTGDGERLPYDSSFLQMIVHRDEDGTEYRFADYFNDDQPDFISRLQIALAENGSNDNASLERPAPEPAAAALEKTGDKSSAEDEGQRIQARIKQIQAEMQSSRTANKVTFERLEQALAA